MAIHANDLDASLMQIQASQSQARVLHTLQLC